MAFDTILVGALRGDASTRRGAADDDGVALVVARRREDLGIQSWWDLVPYLVSLFLVEVGGRWCGRFGTGQIPLRSASDAQASRAVVALRWGSILVHRRTRCSLLLAGSPERQTALMERFFTCARSSGISTWSLGVTSVRCFSVCGILSFQIR